MAPAPSISTTDFTADWISERMCCQRSRNQLQCNAKTDFVSDLNNQGIRLALGRMNVMEKVTDIIAKHIPEVGFCGGPLLLCGR